MNLFYWEAASRANASCADWIRRGVAPPLRDEMLVRADGLAGLRRLLVENAKCIMRSGISRIHT